MLSQQSCSDEREEDTPCRDLASAGIVRRQSGELGAGAPAEVAALFRYMGSRAPLAQPVLEAALSEAPPWPACAASPGIAPLRFSPAVRCLAASCPQPWPRMSALLQKEEAAMQAGALHGAEMLHSLMYRVTNSRGDGVRARVLFCWLA